MIEKFDDISTLNFITAETVDTVLQTALNFAADMNPAILTDIPEDLKIKSRKPVIRQ